MRVIAETSALMRLLCVAGVGVKVEMDKGRIAKRGNYGEAQDGCERALHEGSL